MTPTTLRLSCCALLLIGAAANIANAADKAERKAAAKKAFDLLTANAWTDINPGRAGYKETVTLQRDGSYLWQCASDYVERHDAGTWSLEAASATSGVLRLSATGDLVFKLEPGKLRLGGRSLTSGDKLVYDKKQLALTAADLKPVPPTKIAERLTAEAWIKTNPFDDYRLPHQVQFAADQHYTAIYRDKSCQHSGLWWLVQERERFKFDDRADENQCDLRGGTAGISSDYVRFEGDLLLLGDSYAPVSKKPKQQVFIFDQYGRSVQTRGEFAENFTAGRKAHIDLTHTSADGSDYELKSLDVGLEKYRLTKGGVSADGKPNWVVQRDLTGKQVTQDHSLTQAVEFTPPAAGTFGFTIRLQYANSHQTFDARQIYVATVAEKP